MNTPRHLAVRLLHLVFVISLWSLVLLLGLELFARLAHGRAGHAPSEYSANANFRRVVEAYHPNLWKIPWKAYQPGSSAVYANATGHYEVSINSWGFRGPEFKSQTETNPQLKIACIGGSTTVSGPANDATYPALLETRLRSAGFPATVFNCGVAGMRSADYHLSISNLLQHVRPDIVIEYNGVNDICWVLFRAWRQRLSLVPRLSSYSEFIAYTFGDGFMPDRATIRQELRENIIANLKSLAVLLDKLGVQLCVCSFVYPDLKSMTREHYQYLDHNVRYWWDSKFVSFRRYCEVVDLYNEELKAAFEGSRVIFLPLAESQSFSAEEFVDICHMTSSGIAKKADALVALLGPILAR